MKNEKRIPKTLGKLRSRLNRMNQDTDTPPDPVDLFLMIYSLATICEMQQEQIVKLSEQVVSKERAV